MLRRSERWNDLYSVYRDAIRDTLDLDRKKALLFKVSALQEQKLDDPNAAIGTFREILDLDSEDEPATLALDRLYTTLARYQDLAELLIRRIERAERGGAAELAKWSQLKLRLAGLYENKLSELPKAIDSYEEVIGRDEKSEAALGALERLLADLPERETLRYRVARILDPLYRRADAWQKLSLLLEVQLLFVEDKLRRVDILREVAAIQESRGQDPQAAFQALSRAWLEEAGEGESRERPLFDELCRLAGITSGWRGLVAILEKAVDGSYDFDLTARVWARIARIHDEQLGDRSQAIDAWRKVTGVHDEDDSAWQNLERLLEALQRALEDGDAYARASLAISEFCVRHAGSRRLADLILSFGRQTARYTRLSLSPPERRRQSSANWNKLVKAILAGDAPGAERTAGQLVLDTRDTALQLLTRDP